MTTYLFLAMLTSLAIGLAAQGEDEGAPSEAEAWRDDGRSFEMWTWVVILGLTWPFTWALIAYRWFTAGRK